MVDKPTIHFILPGGGVKGSFQAGFLWCLKRYYGDYFELYQIDGCSVGALNGISYLLDDIDQLKTMWMNIDSLDDLFKRHTTIPILDTILSHYNTFYEKSMLNSNPIKKKIENGLKNVNSKYLDKFNCVVTNIITGNYEYINGTNKDLSSYILASASPWVVSEPIKIANCLYTDGGLIQTYPLKCLKNSSATFKILLGYDETHQNKIGMPGSNVIHFLIRLLEISRKNGSNIKNLEKKIEKYGLIKITNNTQFNFLDINKENIIYGFNDGMLEAHKFAKKYLVKQ
jgi:predicted acylesterase/phospholipase RssA